jgi:hypothetical protein
MNDQPEIQPNPDPHPAPEREPFELIERYRSARRSCAKRRAA